MILINLVKLMSLAKRHIKKTYGRPFYACKIQAYVTEKSGLNSDMWCKLTLRQKNTNKKNAFQPNMASNSNEILS